jgi:hypothetical protein
LWLAIEPFVLVLLTLLQSRSIIQSIGVGAVVIVPHSLHFCARSYHDTSRVSLSHITVISNIRQPHMQAIVGSPLRSCGIFIHLLPIHASLTILNMY